MKIAQLAPLNARVGIDPDPVVIYIERLIAALTDLGHDVTLFGVSGSRCAGNIVSTCEELVAEQFPYWQIRHVLAAEIAYRAAEDFDVIHSHLDVVGLPYVKRSATPTLTTVHHGIDATSWRFPVFRAYGAAPYVTIAPEQIRGLPGTPMEVIPPCMPALKAEISTGERTRAVVAGSALDRAGGAGNLPIDFLGADEEDSILTTDRLASAAVYVDVRIFSASGLLNAIRAIALGIPVVARAEGFLSGLVSSGRNGVLVADPDSWVAATEAAMAIPPAEVSASLRHLAGPVEAAERYVRLYESVASRDLRPAAASEV